MTPSDKHITYECSIKPISSLPINMNEHIASANVGHPARPKWPGHDSNRLLDALFLYRRRCNGDELDGHRARSALRAVRHQGGTPNARRFFYSYDKVTCYIKEMNDVKRFLQRLYWIQDMDRSLGRQKPSCNDEDLAKMTSFTADFGQEGWRWVGHLFNERILRRNYLWFSFCGPLHVI